MYPPVHRILGWASKPSNLSLKRSVWRLDQLKSITYNDIFVKGLPAESDQVTINRFPTLMEAVVLNQHDEKIGIIADLLFDTKTGKILYYLISRSNPKIPGTSRWRFDLSKILDQEPGCISSNILSIDDLPLVRSSIRQELLTKSRKIKENVLEISNLANDKIEGWLDDNDFEDSVKNLSSNFTESFDSFRYNPDSKKNMNDLDQNDEYLYSDQYKRSSIYEDNEEDPWI